MSKVNTNLCVITGNLCRDAELRYTASQKPVLTFTVAVNRLGQDNTQATDYFSCVFWGKTGETLQQYLKKGKSVLVRGSMRSRSYEAKDGTKKTAWELTADNFGGIELLGGGDRKENQSNENTERSRNGYETVTVTKVKQNAKHNDWNPIDVDENSEVGKSDIPF